MLRRAISSSTGLFARNFIGHQDADVQRLVHGVFNETDAGKDLSRAEHLRCTGRDELAQSAQAELMNRECTVQFSQADERHLHQAALVLNRDSRCAA